MATSNNALDSQIITLLKAARACCGPALNPCDFDETEFLAALEAGEFRKALDIVDAIADENPAPVFFFESLLDVSHLLEKNGEPDLAGNIQYYECLLEHFRGSAR